MRSGRRITITIPAAEHAAGRVIQQRSTDELQSGFVLSEIDVDRLSGAPSIVQGGKNGGTAERHGDKIDIRTIEKMRRALWLANEVGEAAQGRQLRPKPRMPRVWSRLSHIAGA